MRWGAFLVLALFASVNLAAAETARIWTDTQGRTFEGKFISADADSVAVERSSDSLRFELDLDQLSKADQAFVAERIAGSQNPAVNSPITETYPASGELLIEIPHNHKLEKWKECEAFLIEEKQDDPQTEKVLAKTKPRVKWDRKEHGMVGMIEFKDVPAIEEDKAVIRFRFTGIWDGESYEQTAYSQTVRLDKFRDGEISLSSVKVRFRKP